eukprot:188730-Hanusia_phi.AAC.2
MSTVKNTRHLQSILRKDDMRKEKGKNSILKSIRDEALKKTESNDQEAEEKAIVDSYLHGITEDRARTLVFQAQQQMDILVDVKSRVDMAIANSTDLMEDETDEKLRNEKDWMADSRRLLNSSIFTYFESCPCEEREEKLAEFCEWFETYENVWPLPMVTSKSQFLELLNAPNPTPALHDNEIGQLFPKIVKMREDLTAIMSVLSKMGQQALNTDLHSRLNQVYENLHSCESTINQQREQLSAKESVIQELKQEIVSNRQHNNKKIEELSEDIAVLQKNVKDKELQIQQIAKKEEEIHRALMIKAEEERKKGQMQLSQQIDALQGTVDAFQTKEEELKANMLVLQARNSDMTRWLVGVAHEMRSMDKELNDTAGAFAADLARMSSQADSEKSLREEVARLHADISSLKGQLRQRDVKMKELDARLQNYEGEVNDKQELIRNLELNQEKLCEEVREVESTSLLASEMVNLLHNQTQDIDAHLESFQTYVKGLTGRIYDIDEVSQSIKQLFFSAKDLFESQRVDLDRLKHHVLHLEMENAELGKRDMAEHVGEGEVQTMLRDASTQSEGLIEPRGIPASSPGDVDSRDKEEADHMERRHDGEQAVRAQGQQVIQDMLDVYGQDVSRLSDQTAENLREYNLRLRALERKIQLAKRGLALKRKEPKEQRDVGIEVQLWADYEETSLDDASNESNGVYEPQVKEEEQSDERVRGSSGESDKLEPNQLSYFISRFKLLKEEFDKHLLALTSDRLRWLSPHQDEDRAQEILSLLAGVLDDLHFLLRPEGSSSSRLGDSGRQVLPQGELQDGDSRTRSRLSGDLSLTDSSKAATLNVYLQRTQTNGADPWSSKKYVGYPMQHRQERRPDGTAPPAALDARERSAMIDQVETSFADSKASMAKTQERAQRVSFSSSPEPRAKSRKQREVFQHGEEEDYPSVPLSHEVDLLLLHRQQQLKAMRRAFAANNFSSSLKPGKVLRSLESELSDKVPRKLVRVAERPGNPRASAASFINSVTGPDATKLPILQAPSIPCKTSYIRPEELAELVTLRKEMPRKTAGT